MSTDFYMVCDRCRKARHLATRFAASVAFGDGSPRKRLEYDTDDPSRRIALNFIVDHVEHGSLRVVLAEGTEDYEDA